MKGSWNLQFPISRLPLPVKHNKFGENWPISFFLQKKLLMENERRTTMAIGHDSGDLKKRLEGLTMKWNKIHELVLKILALANILL